MKKMLFALGATILTNFAFGQSASFPIEGNVGYINFNDNVNYKDSWYVGGTTGFNFTDNAGIRGYYWRTLQDSPKLKKDELFDQLEIYGAETKVAIPITKYTKPYLLAGGGLLKPFGNYVGEDGTIVSGDKFFGSAGAGLDLNFIDFLSITGYARAMVMDFEQFDNIAEGDNKIKASWNYGGSINFLIGRNGIQSKNKAKRSKADVVMPAAKEYQLDLERQQEELKSELRSYKKETRTYNKAQDRVDELRRQIEQLENNIGKNELYKKQQLQQDFSSINSSIDSLNNSIDDYDDNDLEAQKRELTSLIEELKRKQLQQQEDIIVTVPKTTVETIEPNNELEIKYAQLVERLESQQKEIERLSNQKQVVAEPQKIVIEDKRATPVSSSPTQIIEKVVEKEIPDNDRDGILNDIDKCPNVAGPLANNGCPTQTVVAPQIINRPVETRIIERAPQRIEVERKMNFYAQSVFFETNSAKIKGSSLTNLNEIYNLMQQHPSTNYVVEGHTDSIGDASYNKTLSQKRAQSVVNYLVNKGIPASNLSSIGYGEEQPIAGNDTKAGREQNRRVVIRMR